MLMIEIEAVANFVIAQYNTSPHSELNERQPALLFEQDANKNGINNFTDFEAFRIDTMKIVPGAQLTPAGINTFGCLRHADVRA
ncbi:hypothetical protein, partial [Pseudomonas sp. AH2 (2023)]|uniref:hypothetical protein n=1 Tax=Pseudomonas sp. AH2 (2023) TaxID=3048599 RepID=UPI002B22B526